jgi:peptide/nickel transport system permease protein
MKARILSASGIIGGGLIFGLAGLVVLGLFWTPFDPLGIDLTARLQAPSAQHWLGTDEFGRDVFSRAITGARVSGFVASLTVLLAISFGTVIGLVCGYVRGWTDKLCMATTDALLAFPGILLAMGLMVILGADQYGIILALGLAYLPSVIRVVRSAVLSVREKEYVEASRMIGNSGLRTVLRHVLPNVMAPIAILATSMFGWVLLAESALSFLGLGIAPPAPTWGNMLASSRPYMETASWLGIVPGGFIALTLLGVNLLGDFLRDCLDPRREG